MSDDIDVRVALEDALSVPVKVAAENLKKLGRQALKSGADLETLAKSLDNAGDEAAQLAAKAEAAKLATKGLGDESVKSSKGVDQLDRKAKKAVVSLEKMFKWGKAWKVLWTGFKWGAIIQGVTGLVTALNGLAAATGASVAGLAPMSALLGAFPGLLASGAQAMGTFKLATKGVGAAISAAFGKKADPAKFAEAMKNLAPNAQKFALSLKGVSGSWSKMQKGVQNRFFEGFGTDVEKLSKAYLPVLNKELDKTAVTMNKLARGGAAWLMRSGNKSLIESILAGNNQNLPYLGKTVGNLLGTTLQFMNAAQPMVLRISKGLDSWSSSMLRLTTSKKTSISAWLNSGYDRWIGFKNASTDYLMGVYGIFKASKPLVDFLGNELSMIGERFNKWANSTSGQKKLTDWWRSQIPVVRELGSWVETLSKLYADIGMKPGEFVKISKEMRDVLPPAIEKIVNAAKGGHFLESFLKIINSFATIADSGALNSFGIILSGIASGISLIATAIDKTNTGKLVTLVGVLLTLRKFSGGAKKGGIAGGLLNVATYGLFARGGGKGVATAAAEGAAVRGATTVGAELGGTAGIAYLVKSVLGNSRIVTMLRAAVMKAPAVGVGATLGYGVGSAIGGKGRGTEGMILGGALATRNPWVIGGVAAGIGLFELGKQVKKQNDDWATTIDKINMAAKVAADTKERDSESALRSFLSATDTPIKAPNPASKYAPPKPKAPKPKAPFPAPRYSPIKTGNKPSPYIPRGPVAYKPPAVITPINRAPAMLQPAAPMVPKVDPKPSIAAINAIKDSFDLTKNNVKTPIKVDAKTKDAKNKIDGVTTSIRKIPKDPTINLHAKLVGVQDVINSFNNLKTSLSGDKPRFAGGDVMGKHLVGELGPEAHISRTGKISMVGMHGAEYKNFTGGAILPSSATFNPMSGNTGLAPDWAVKAYREKAGAGVSLMPRMTERAMPTTEQYHYHQHAPITNQTPMDIEREFRKFMKTMSREKAERE